MSIDGKGIKYGHTYTLLDTRTVKLENGYTDIIGLFRNPSGKSSRGLQWTGDWAPDDDLWSKHTKVQVGGAAKLTSTATFWMSFEDVYEQFETVTINYCDVTYNRRCLNADILTY